MAASECYDTRIGTRWMRRTLKAPFFSERGSTLMQLFHSQCNHLRLADIRENGAMNLLGYPWVVPEGPAWGPDPTDEIYRVILHGP